MASNADPAGNAAPNVPPPAAPIPPSGGAPSSKPTDGSAKAPITQAPGKPEKQGKRSYYWWKQLPRFFGFNELNENWQLLDPNELNALLATVDAEAAEKIRRDVEVLDHEVLRLFRRLDHEAAKQQNRYRRIQLEYALLALTATVLGSIMALTLESAPWLTPILGIGETAVALFTAFIVALTSDEPPQQLWLQNRLRAEFLRREYFRYLMRLAPYDNIPDDFDRETLLAKRAADINRGFFPELPQPNQQQ